MSETQAALAAQLPASTRTDREPIFAEPWQAQAFAMAVTLLEQGVFSRQEWAATLGEEIAGAAEQGIADDGSGYYELWLRALERLVTAKRLCDGEELAKFRRDWEQAYRETRHGQAVVLPES